MALLALQAVILAAGKGTRMKSAPGQGPSPVLGVPLLEHVLRTVQARGRRPRSRWWSATRRRRSRRPSPGAACGFVRQEPPLGTGPRACRSRASAFAAHPDRTLLVVNGDVPLLRPETLPRLLAAHRAARGGGHAADRRSSTIPAPTAASSADETGGVRAIVEAKDATRRASADPRDQRRHLRLRGRAAPARCWAGCSRRTPRASTT